METGNYLGTEKTGKLLVKFCIPCIASLIISCLYNIVDQIFVGNGIGYLGNAATGVIFPITVIGWGMSLFFGDGAAAYLSVALGRNETETVHRGIGNSILFSFLSGVVIILISYLGGDSLLRLIGATDATVALAHEYGYIIYIMMPLAMTQNTLASIIRADGSPRYAMGAMIVGALINIVGDPVAIFVLDMGIQGAAWATILGQFVSFVICALYLMKSKTFRLQAKSFLVDIRQLRQIMALGTSSLLTQLSIVVITVVNNILLVKYGAASVYGADIPLAAFVVIMKLFQIVLNIAIGIAAGAQPIVGYNYGARKYDRVRELLKAVLKWTALVGLVCMALFEIFPGAFIRLFGSDGELYMEFAVRCLRIYLLLIMFTCLQKVCAIFLQSIGRAQAAAPLAILRDLLLIVFSIIVPIFSGVTGIFWAAPIADVFAMLITAAVMWRLWKELQEVGKQAQPEMSGYIQPSKPGVIVTISREHGSAGKRIGQLLAQMMQIPCYYDEDKQGEMRRKAESAEIVFEKVQFSYVPGRPVLQDFTLRVPPGRKVALVGATGSGKTTVVNLLMRFYDIDSGEILINQQNIEDIAREELRKNIAIVLQDTVLFSESIRDNLKYGNAGAGEDAIISAAERSQCREMIEMLPQGYDTVLTGSGENLSQGQRQLLAIARAFVADPQILILDEATSNVDTRTEKAIQDAMHLIMQNRTSIVIAHRLSTIRDADMIVVMDQGRIVESGDHETLFAQKGKYYELCMTQYAGIVT